MPPSADEYRAGLLALQQQQRARLTSLIEQIDGSLAYDWQRGMGAAASLYGPILDQYARDLAALREAEDDPAARLGLDWLTGQRSKLATIQASVAASADKYGAHAAQTITRAQEAATQQAAMDAAQLTQRSLWPAVEGAGVPPSVLFNRPNPDAIAQWVGRAGNGHPLGDLFEGFGAEATQGARQAMMLGLLTGANPKAMASGIASALGISRSRATIISRTEVLGSYRSAALETYRANSDVVSGWMWSASSNNPCALCMGMDGLIFTLEEFMAAHPCCRCAPLPVTKSWNDILSPLGIDGSDIPDTSIGAPGAYETGPEKFARMSPQQQRAIIGTKTGYEAYQRGEVELQDFIGKRVGEDGFPASYYQKSLKEMEIPTGRAGTPLVERSPRLTELERAGKLKARDFGAPIPVDEMPRWAQRSPASQAVYQIMRNGLPWNMAGQELPLLAQNIEQMLTEDLSLNVRMAALRLQDMLKQYDTYLERYVRNVTSGASTLGKAPEFVYKPSKELERALAAARRGETGIAQIAESAVARQTAKELTDAEFRDAVLAAHVRNADSSGFSAIRQVRNEVMRQTGITRAEFDARLRAFVDAEAKGPDDLVAHLETNYDAHSGIRGRLDYNGRSYDFLQLSRGSEFENIIAGEAPSGNAAAGSLRGITREAFEAEQGIKSAAGVAEGAIEQEIAGAAINLDRMTAEQLATEEAQALKALRPHGIFGLNDLQERVANDLGARLAGNADFQQIAAKLTDFFNGNLRIETPEDIAGALIRAWSGGTGNPFSAALQLAIRDEFGLNAAAELPGALLQSAAELTDLQPGLRAFARAVYDNTQEYLAREGITELPLFRGSTFEHLPESIDKALLDGNVHQIAVELRAVSSFTADEKWAAEFATFSSQGTPEYGVAMAGRVPAELVLSTAQTGLGNLGEAEVLVFGGNYDLAMIGVRIAETPLTQEDVASLLTQPLERALAAARAGERTALEATQVATSDIEQTASREAVAETDAAIKDEIGRAATHIAPEDVAKWTANNAEGVPSVAYHAFHSEDTYNLVMREGADINQAIAKSGEHAFLRGLYMTEQPLNESTIGADFGNLYGEHVVPLAVHMENPLILEKGEWVAFTKQIIEGLPNGEWRVLHAADETFWSEYQAAFRDYLEKHGYDGIIRETGMTGNPLIDREIIAFKPGTVRVITPSNAR